MKELPNSKSKLPKSKSPLKPMITKELPLKLKPCYNSYNPLTVMIVAKKKMMVSPKDYSQV